MISTVTTQRSATPIFFAHICAALLLTSACSKSTEGEAKTGDVKAAAVAAGAPSTKDSAVTPALGPADPELEKMARAVAQCPNDDEHSFEDDDCKAYGAWMDRASADDDLDFDEGDAKGAPRQEKRANTVLRLLADSDTTTRQAAGALFAASDLTTVAQGAALWNILTTEKTASIRENLGQHLSQLDRIPELT